MINIYENDKVRAAYAKMYMTESDTTSAENGNDSNSEQETASTSETPVAGTHKLVDDDNPAVWIGTYENYNNGSLYGEGEASGWVDLTTFADADEFHEWLDEQANGKDVEWMFQDYQCFPSSLYGESNIDGVWDYIDFKNNTSLSDEQVDALLGEYDLEELMKKDINGEIYVYSGCRTMGDVAYRMIEDNGTETFSDHMYQNAFDFEAFGRDISLEWDESANEGKDAYESFGVTEDDDEALGEAYVDQVYGDIKELGKETMMNYIDYDKLGGDLEYDGNWISCGNDMIEVVG